MNVNDILKSGVSAGYNVDIAREFGINEAIVLNKLVYLHQIAKRGDGFTWYTAKDWKEHTGLSYYQVNKALQHLVNAGIVEVKNTYIQGTTTKAKHHRFAVQETSKSGIQETSKSGIQETSKSVNNNAKNIVSNSEVSKKLLDLLNEKTKRNFRILPRGYKETLKKFSLEEIGKALDILVEDDWHSKKINELKSDYLLRASTIDNMLSKRKKQHEGMADLDELMGDGSWMA
nr:MAG TPA: helix-turn-helix domain protein [Caudoviricetes sp.]